MKTLGGITLLAGMLAFLSWTLMILVGVIHNDWISILPPIGFWTSVLITAILLGRAIVTSLVAEAFKAAGKDRY